MVNWVIQGQLAISPRPGFPSSQVMKEEVDAWLDLLRAEGIVSIICLLDDELEYYRQVPGGLIEYYRACGFDVTHVPVADLRVSGFSDARLDDVWNAYEELAKPVVVHCGAGVDRTGKAISWINKKLGLTA